MKLRLRYWRRAAAAAVALAGATAANAAGPAPFDLTGPTLEVSVTRGETTLPIAQVPHLAAGDKLFIQSEFPEEQSEH
jgi:hypothetical protein